MKPTLSTVLNFDQKFQKKSFFQLSSPQWEKYFKFFPLLHVFLLFFHGFLLHTVGFISVFDFFKRLEMLENLYVSRLENKTVAQSQNLTIYFKLSASKSDSFPTVKPDWFSSVFLLFSTN